MRDVRVVCCDVFVVVAVSSRALTKSLRPKSKTRELTRRYRKSFALARAQVNRQRTLNKIHLSAYLQSAPELFTSHHSSTHAFTFRTECARLYYCKGRHSARPYGYNSLGPKYGLLYISKSAWTFGSIRSAINHSVTAIQLRSVAN